MFTSLPDRSISHTVRSLACLSVFIGAAAFSCDEYPTDVLFSSGTANLMITGADGGALEVSINGGEVKVKLNGEELPADRILREGNRLIILDEHGKPMSNFNMIIGTPGAQGLAGAVAMRHLWTDAASPTAIAGGQGGMGWVTAANAEPPKVMMGVTMSPTNTALEKHLKLEPGTTTMLSGVYEGLPAHAAGLAEFDIIVKVDGQSPADPDRVRKVLAEKNPGDSLVFSVIQAGQPARDVALKLEDYDGEKMQKAAMLGSGATSDLFTTLRVAPQAAVTAEVDAAYRRMLEQRLVTPDGQPFIKSYSAPRSMPSQQVIEERLQQIDERLATLDRLIQQLAETKESKGKTAP